MTEQYALQQNKVFRLPLNPLSNQGSGYDGVRITGFGFKHLDERAAEDPPMTNLPMIECADLPHLTAVAT